MSDIDYDALRGGDGGLPEDGLHRAYLARAALAETSRGSMLVTEWQTTTNPPSYWQTWFGFNGQRLRFTQELLDALGIDRGKLMDDDALQAALDSVQGTVYQIRTERWGDSGVNTYVLDSTAQAQLTDVPIETEDLPVAGVAASAAAAEDDDIPF
jgi:hypothetical protein